MKPSGSSLVEIDLIEQPDGTLLRLTHTGLPNAEQRRPCGRLGPLPRPAGRGGGRARPGPGPPARPHRQRVTVFRSRHRGSSPLPDLTYGWRPLGTSCPIRDAGLLMTAPRRRGRATANPRVGLKIAPFMLHTPTSDDHGCCREHEAPPRIYN